MNKAIAKLLVLYLSLGSTVLKAQYIMVVDPYHFCAMNGSCYNQPLERFVTIVNYDYLPETAIYETEQFMAAHPSFELISLASKRYNCHGYAYSVAQGGDTLQIGWKEDLCAYNGSNNNQSYTMIPAHEKQKDDIVTIIDDNYYPLQSRHSSIVYNDTMLISKFNDYPLFKHSINDPWFLEYSGIGMDSHCVYYRRVVNTQLTGPDIIDGSGTYVFTPTPNINLASCTWSVEPSDMFQTSSGTGYTASLTYKTPFTYLAPKARITFTFSYSCDNHYSVSKEIDLLIPTTTITGTAVSDGFVLDTNAIVTVSGEIRSNPKAKAIVPTGTKLIVDGGSMTSNGDWFWPGIQVWGNSALHQYPLHGSYLQGYLELKDGATIENAVCAVELWHPGDWNSTGGIVRADSAFFRNNAMAAHALDYANINPYSGRESDYDAHFSNCTFALDGDYLGTEVSPLDNGIAAYDAGFTVGSYCSCPIPNIIPRTCPEGCLVPSTFEGFHCAVSSVHEGGTARAFSVRGAVFSGNNCGVFAENTGNATVLGNTFRVGRDAELDGLTSQIAQRLHDRSVAAGDIVRGILSDTATDHRELRTWLRNMGDLGSDRLAVASYVQEGDFEGAFALARALLEETSRERGTRYRCPELPKITEKGKGSADTEEREATDFNVTVTPNPATTQVAVEYILPEGSSRATLSIVNTFGEKMLGLGLDGNRGSTVVDLHELPAGVYFFVVTDLNGRTSSVKMIHQ